MDWPGSAGKPGGSRTRQEQRKQKNYLSLMTGWPQRVTDPPGAEEAKGLPIARDRSVPAGHGPAGAEEAKELSIACDRSVTGQPRRVTDPPRAEEAKGLSIAHDRSVTGRPQRVTDPQEQRKRKDYLSLMTGP
jgi:hypothetical protein